MTEKQKRLEVAGVFFRLGCIAFGGPAAHIAMMEEEIVQKRKWMDRQHFLDLIGATNLIPGPNSTEMTMHCGRERAGVAGLFIAGFCFIIPAVMLTGLLAWLYSTYGQLPSVEPFVYGIKPAVLALIASAVFKLGQKALKNRELIILGLMALVASLLGANEIMALLGTGLAGSLYFWAKERTPVTGKNVFSWLLLPAPIAALSGMTAPKIFWIFLKIGATLYGSGYVLFAYLDAELVVRGWLDRQELLDAVAIGQFTPGPVLSTATFIGYQLMGIPGAGAATLGIFLPSFLLVWMLNPLVPKLRQSKWLGFFLDSVNVAAVAVMASVLVQLGWETLADWKSVLIAGFGLMLTFGPWKAQAVWTVLGGALLGYLLSFF